MNLKHNWQRFTRGYSDYDIKNVNSFIIEKLQPVIKAYVTYEAEKGHSLPTEFASDPAAWLNILRDIEYAFDWMYKEEFGEGYKSDSEENTKTHYNRVKNGFKMFGQYLNSTTG